MEQRDNVREDNHDSGTWVIALAPGGGTGYIGRVEKLDGKNAYEKADGRRERSSIGELVYIDKLRSELPIDEVLSAEAVTLNPVYAYREMVKEVPIINPETGKMMQDPNVPGIPLTQPMRTPLIMPVGFTLEAAPVHLRGKHYDFRFLSQMHPRDAETQRDFVRQTRLQMQEMRMKASGLAAPTQEETARANRSKT